MDTQRSKFKLHAPDWSVEISIVSRFNNKILNKKLLNLEQKININIDQFKIVLIIKFISWKIFQLIC